MRNFRFIRALFRSTKTEKNETELREQADPFLPARHHYVFQHFNAENL